MDEQRLYDILGQDLEVPHMVNRKLEQAYAQLGGKRRPAKGRGLRPLRTVLIAAALIAALCATATAAYQTFRREVPVSEPQLVQGILGQGLPSWEREEIRSEDGRLIAVWPHRDAAPPVDGETAMRLLGDCLPESGYQWQIGGYTLTVEGYVLDENTSTGRIYYSIEHPGGFGEGAVDWERGWPNNEIFPVGISVKTLSEVSWPWLSSARTYIDTALSTPEKLYFVEPLTAPKGGWKAADGMRIQFYDYTKDSGRLQAAMEVPGVPSLPAVTITDPETGEVKARVSAIGMMVDTRYLFSNLPDGSGVSGQLQNLVLEYADGSRYVVMSADADNTDYGCYDEHSEWLRIVFNRLVDPSQVAAVIVDGQRYSSQNA